LLLDRLYGERDIGGGHFPGRHICARRVSTAIFISHSIVSRHYSIGRCPTACAVTGAVTTSTTTTTAAAAAAAAAAAVTVGGAVTEAGTAAVSDRAVRCCRLRSTRGLCHRRLTSLSNNVSFELGVYVGYNLRVYLSPVLWCIRLNDLCYCGLCLLFIDDQTE
jgi:hypothetical protein